MIKIKLSKLNSTLLLCEFNNFPPFLSGRMIPEDLDAKIELAKSQVIQECQVLKWTKCTINLRI